MQVDHGDIVIAEELRTTRKETIKPNHTFNDLIKEIMEIRILRAPTASEEGIFLYQKLIKKIHSIYLYSMICFSRLVFI